MDAVLRPREGCGRGGPPKVPAVMAQQQTLDIASLIARRRPGYSLEAPFYTSREIFDLDLELIFSRHWLFVAVEPEIPEPGDYLLVEIGTASIIILRDDEGLLRAVHNVCRHRGARMLHAERGTIGKLVCPYHSWTYELDGQLLWAEHMGREFDVSCQRLKPVHLRSLEGLVFICLAETPPEDFEDMARAMTAYLAPHGLRDCKVAKQIDLVEHGNWKLTIENNRECYHCGANHPELTMSLFAEGFGYAPEELDEAGRAQARHYDAVCERFAADWERQGLAWQLVEHLDDRPTGFRTQRLVIDGEGESQTLDTRAASRRLLGDLGSAKLGGLHFWTQPNSWHHLMADHVVTFAVLPLAPDRSLLRTTWLVHKDAIEGIDYDVENLTSVWVATNEQDSTLVGYTQDGVSSPAYLPGPYSPHTEMLVEKCVLWYLRRLSAGLGL
jgi:glycine betaine catabolism A